jgi:hypothetical protein
MNMLAPALFRFRGFVLEKQELTERDLPNMLADLKRV